MDMNSKIAIELLQALADCNQMLSTLYDAIQTKPEVIKPIKRIEIERYRLFPIIQCYVDAELKSGKAICWWLEVYCGPDRWEIQSVILMNDEQGQRSLREFPTRFADAFDAFLNELAAAMTELVASVNLVELT